jgi:nucleolar protein 14
LDFTTFSIYASTASRSLVPDYNHQDTLHSRLLRRPFLVNMPPSQLKRLKASLREQGITGPQKGKKEKKSRKGDNADQRAKKAAALASIRESFNPFEFKTLARPKKFEVVTNRPENKVVLGRPGVTKSHGEETVSLPKIPRYNQF